MEFTVPQFIDRKPKIVGPFSFGQLAYFGVAIGICLFLWFIVPFQVFVVCAIILFAAAFALALVKIEKIPLPVIIKNFFLFSFKPKIYLWKRKDITIKNESFQPQVFIKKTPSRAQQSQSSEKSEKKAVVGTTTKSKLNELFNRLEIK